MTSDGSRSGVNWMRLHVPFTEWAIALASDVLPVPGTSSSSRWPSVNRHTRASAIWSRLPLMTCSTLSSRALNQWLNHSACWSVAWASCRSPVDAVSRHQRRCSDSAAADGDLDVLVRVAEVARASSVEVARSRLRRRRAGVELPPCAGAVAVDLVAGRASRPDARSCGRSAHGRVRAAGLADGRAALADGDRRRRRRRGGVRPSQPLHAPQPTALHACTRTRYAVSACRPSQSASAPARRRDAARVDLDLGSAVIGLPLSFGRRPGGRTVASPGGRRSRPPTWSGGPASCADGVAAGAGADVVDGAHLERVRRCRRRGRARVYDGAVADVLPAAAVDATAGSAVIGAAVGSAAGPRRGDAADVGRRRW